MNKLAKMIHAMRLSGVPRKLCENYAWLIKSKEITHKNIRMYFRKLSACVDSSKTLEVLKDLFGRITIIRIRFNEVFELYPQDPDFALKVLQLIASTYSTSLSCFTIYSRDENISESLPKLEKEMWGEIAKLQNLRELSINKFCITITDLMEMCRNMPKLESIEIVIDSKSRLPVDSEGFASKFSNAFGRVQEFLFDLTVRKDVFEADWSADDLINFIIKQLPELVLVGSNNWNSDMSVACIEMKITSKLKRLQLTALNLEEVAKNFDKFPSVTSLTIVFDSEKDDDNHPLSKEVMKSLRKLEKITLLEIFDLMSTVKLKNFLKVFRRNLKHLILDYTKVDPLIIDLNLIRDMCPNLRILDLHATDIVDLISDSMASFTSLRQLEIIFFFDCRDLNLSCLLEPPNLRIVQLRGFWVTEQEFEKTIELFEMKKILTKIESLDLELNDDIDAQSKNFFEREFERFAHLLQEKNVINQFGFLKNCFGMSSIELLNFQSL